MFKLTPIFYILYKKKIINFMTPTNFIYPYPSLNAPSSLILTPRQLSLPSYNLSRKSMIQPTKFFTDSALLNPSFCKIFVHMTKKIEFNGLRAYKKIELTVIFIWLCSILMHEMPKLSILVILYCDVDMTIICKICITQSL